MTIEYLTDTGRLRVEHVEESEVRRWTAEHPLAMMSCTLSPMGSRPTKLRPQLDLRSGACDT